MELTAQEIENMRALVREHDKKHLGKAIDMSKPVIVPYPKHLAFPKAVYDHSKCLPSRWVEKESVVAGGRPTKEPALPHFETKIVNSQAELEAALEEGWKIEPPDFNATKPRVGRPPKVA